MKNLKILSLGIAMLISFLSFGQQKTITGNVSDASGPLPGANVIVKGTQRGIMTDFDGKYSIKASKDETLVFSFMGKNDVTKIIGDTTILNIFLEEADVQLKTELPCCNFSGKKKKEIIHCTTTVSVKDIETKNGNKK